MNIVFYGLVALSILFSTYTKGIGRDAELHGVTVTVDVLSNSPVSTSGAAEVESGGVVWPGTILSRAGTKVTVTTLAPDGPVLVRFTEETGVSAVSNLALGAANDAVLNVALKLVGAMTLFLGLMKVVEKAGGLDDVARAIRPVMIKLFPDVPVDHPAMGAMILNLAANVLGLGNAATPFGIKAMQELQTLNKTPDTATNAMARFLAINTAGVAVLPTGVMAVRAAAGSHDPAAVFLTTLCATSFASMSAIVSSKLLEGPVDRVENPPVRILEFLPLTLAFSVIGALVAAVYSWGDRASAWIVPGLIFGLLTVGVVRKVKVYEVFIEGAKEGFNSAIRIIPYLIAVLVAVAMFRASGGLERMVTLLGPPCAAVGLPAETLPLVLLRPLSGSGAFALMTDLTRAYGPDTYIGHIAGTVQGSHETTFYVLAVYFGAVGISKSRHAVACGLIADLFGTIGTVIAVRLLLGS